MKIFKNTRNYGLCCGFGDWMAVKHSVGVGSVLISD